MNLSDCAKDGLLRKLLNRMFPFSSKTARDDQTILSLIRLSLGCLWSLFELFLGSLGQSCSAFWALLGPTYGVLRLSGGSVGTLGGSLGLLLGVSWHSSRFS